MKHCVIEWDSFWRTATFMLTWERKGILKKMEYACSTFMQYLFLASGFTVGPQVRKDIFSLTVII